MLLNYSWLIIYEVLHMKTLKHAREQKQMV